MTLDKEELRIILQSDDAAELMLTRLNKVSKYPLPIKFVHVFTGRKRRTHLVVEFNFAGTREIIRGFRHISYVEWLLAYYKDFPDMVYEVQKSNTTRELVEALVTEDSFYRVDVDLQKTHNNVKRNNNNDTSYNNTDIGSVDWGGGANH